MQCARSLTAWAAQLPDLILILILNFMPQLRVWLDFLAGNQSAAAAVAALAAALLLPSKLRQFDTLETCILAASLATHSLRRRQHFVASCLSHSESGDSPQVPPGRAQPQLQQQLQLQFPQFPSSSSSFHNHNLPRCAAISEQTWASQVSDQLRSCTCHTPDLQAPMVT